jgi:predicted signal transduction protein with EAL and GGDEF domain
LLKDVIQGYWFAKPMPAARVPGWLREFECGSAKTEAAAAHLCVASGVELTQASLNSD